MLKVKLLSRGRSVKPYVSSVATSGRVQKAFAEQIGKPAGACVRSGVKAGMNQSDIKKVVADCGKKHTGTKLKL